MQKKSFTLIEMLIVVVIIGILAAALIPRLQSVQARARDTKRKADLHQIATALEIYKEDNGGFRRFENKDPAAYVWSLYVPGILTIGSSTDESFTFGMKSLENYMTSIPSDSNQTPWYAASDQVQGYALALMNQHTQGIFSLNAFVLGAKTESDGSSSNRVSSVQESQGSSTMTGDGCTDLSNSNFCGAIGAGGQSQGGYADGYNQWICSTVTLDSGTQNYGNGTCFANKGGDDLRYIYVN